MDGNDWVKLVLIMAGVIFVTIVAVGAGSYIFIRLFAKTVNTRQRDWERSAGALGLSADRTKGGIYKTLTGTRNGFRVDVNHVGLNTRMAGDAAIADDGAEVTVDFRRSLQLSFELEKRAMLYQQIEGFFAESVIGHEQFDRVFKITASDTPTLATLLGAELPGGETATLLTDLLLTAKNYDRIQLTDRSITLANVVALGDDEGIARIIDRAIYLAERMAVAVDHQKAA